MDLPHRIFRIAVLASAVAGLLAVALPARASDIRTERVHFARGANSATVEGRIHGRETVDYVLGARAGQTMNVSLASQNGGAYFNLIAPGETDVAFFNGQMGNNQFEGALPKDGDYKVRVYLVPAAARRGETAHFRLEMVIAGAAHAAAAGAAPAARAGASTSERAGQGQFDATGMIPCAQHAGQPMGQCKFGVARGKGGEAAVAVMLLDGRTRVIFFEGSKAVGADTSQADGNKPFSVRREADLNMIRVGDERYEIPDAVPLGG